MKARIRKTGEVVDVISFGGTTLRSNNDWVSYIDTEGRECPQMSLNRYWDFEDIGNLLSTTSPDWEQRLYELSKVAMQGMLSNNSYNVYDNGFSDDNRRLIASLSIMYANEMIKQLKEIPTINSD